MAGTEDEARARLWAAHAWAEREGLAHTRTEFYQFIVKHCPSEKSLSEAMVRRCFVDDPISKKGENAICAAVAALEEARKINLEPVPVEPAAKKVRNAEARLDDEYVGAWTLVQYRSVRDKDTELRPPKWYRVALIVYGADIRKTNRRHFEIFGLTTQWTGEVYKNDNKLYYRAREVNSGKEDVFIICNPAFEREDPPEHHGIILGVGRSKIDPHPIYASRCLIRRNDLLGDDLRELRSNLMKLEFRRRCCMYYKPEQVPRLRGRKRNGDLENFILTTVADFRAMVENSRDQKNEGDRLIFQS
jgi:hypothetical protein